MRAHVKAAETFERQDVLAGAGARALRRRAAGLQGRADRRSRRQGARRRRGREGAGPLRPCRCTRTGRSPTSAAARTRRARRPSARSSCTRSPAPTGAGTRPHDAHAHLRHGVLLEGRARASTWSGSSRPRNATTASSAASSGCSASPTSRPAPPSGCRRARASGTRSCGLSRQMGRERGYSEVKTPQIYDAELWKTSGHWEKYRENMFTVTGRGARDGRQADELPGPRPPVRDERHSYRDLPVRYSEPGLLHRNEASGVLHGLLRVRHFAQDDAHIFCTEEQVAGGGQGLPGDGVRHLQAVRLRRHASSSRRAPSSGSAAMRCGTAPRRSSTRTLERAGSRLRAEPRRWRVLRAEDRHAHDRLARALLAARDGAARLLDARALRADLHRRGQPGAPPGDDPPRAVRLLRALHRDHARALRRRAAAVADAGAGDRAAGLRPLQRVRRDRSASACAARTRASSSTSAASRSGARSARPSCARSRTC